MALFGGSDKHLQHRVKDLERRVAALERAAREGGGWAPSYWPSGEPDQSWVSDEVRLLAMQGNKIEAIRLLREETGMGLREAKEIVDGL